jgi:hypothetical protein
MFVVNYSLLVLSPINLLFVGCYNILFVGVITNKLLFFSFITSKHKCINFNVKRFAQGIGADILFMAWQVRCNKMIGVRARCRLYVMFVVNLNAFSGMCPNTSIVYA